MGKRRRYQRAGLLTITLIITVPCFAQAPRLLILRSPDQPVAGSPWTLTLMIAHAEPDEVDVKVPHFTGSLMLDQVTKAPRFFNPYTGQILAGNTDEDAPSFERWTAMEYRFMFNSSGTFSFDIFTVITPYGQIETDPFDLIVLQQNNTAMVQNYRLVWEQPATLIIGETALVSLRINSRETVRLPPAGLFLPPVPPGHILESVPPSPEERSQGIAITLRLIPLETGPFVLERRMVTHNDAVFEIPALRIPVGRSPGGSLEENESAPRTAAPAVRFPAFEEAARDYPGLYQKRRDECDAIYTAAKNLWENGQRVKALAELRRGERDHPAGAIFAVLRRRAEAAIGITGAHDEKKRQLWFLKERTQSAVLGETAVRQIPDPDGAEIARFREGQPVRINIRHGSWLRVITHDSHEISGWIPEENIIIY